MTTQLCLQSTSHLSPTTTTFLGPSSSRSERNDGSSSNQLSVGSSCSLLLPFLSFNWRTHSLGLIIDAPFEDDSKVQAAAATAIFCTQGPRALPVNRSEQMERELADHFRTHLSTLKLPKKEKK